MPNVVICSHQVTIDTVYQVDEHLTETLRYLVGKGLFKKHEEALKSIVNLGADGDVHFRLENIVQSARDLAKAEAYLDDQGFKKRQQIGGNPGIMALRGNLLREGNTHSDLPVFRYVGILPRTVRDFIESTDSDSPHRKVFNPEWCVGIEAEPRTVALESDHKIMFSYNDGRDLTELTKPGASFSKYISYIRKVWKTIKKVLSPLLYLFPIRST